MTYTAGDTNRSVKPPRSVASSGWFVVAAAARRTTIDGQRTMRPTTTAHAKTFGERTTACGLHCDNYVRIWEVAFPSTEFVNCAECRESIAARRRLGKNLTTSPDADALNLPRG
jgi:hypothetical protein